MLGWHFLAKDRRLKYGDKRLVNAGETLRTEDTPVMCMRGMHASKRIMDALKYAPTDAAIVCHVRLSDGVLHSDDKSVAHERTCIWWVHAEAVLHEFACRCTEDALALIKTPDPRRIATISDSELTAARAAARDAARAPASAAAWAAAWAAWDAARPAARDAAWAATWDRQNRRLTSMVVTLHRRQQRR